MTTQSLQFNLFDKDQLNILMDKDSKCNFVVSLKKKSVILTKREAQCAFLLFRGMTAEQTGKFLTLSGRTVESHLENIKRKLKCRRKIEILKHLIL